MLYSPVTPTPTPRPKLSWRQKLRLSLAKSPASPYKSPKQVPSLSNLPSLTPRSTKRSGDDTDFLLTPLDVLEEIADFNVLLSNQVDIKAGDYVIPPPPRRRWSTRKSVSGDGSPAPRVKPYFNSALKPERKGARALCFICGDTLESRLETEKLVQLDCGDCIHGDCLKASVEILAEQQAGRLGKQAGISEETVQATIFPLCKGPCCTLKPEPAAVQPLDQDVVQDIMTDVMLSLKIASLRTSGPGAAAALPELEFSSFDVPEFAPLAPRAPPTPRTPHNAGSRRFLMQEAATPRRFEGHREGGPVIYPDVNLSFSNIKKVDIADFRMPPDNLPEDSVIYNNRVSQYYVRDNLLLRPRSTATQLSQEVSILLHFGKEYDPPALTFPDNSKYSLEELRSLLVKHMLTLCPLFDLGCLVSLGPLRLVDRLSVAVGDTRYALLTVYLFANYLVVAHGVPVLLALDSATIRTPETSLIHFESADLPPIRLWSVVDSIIEKWGIIVSDPLLLLPADLITSTLNASEIRAAPATVPRRRPFGKPVVKTRESRALLGNQELLADESGFGAELRRIGLLGLDLASPLNVWRRRSLPLPRPESYEVDGPVSEIIMEYLEPSLALESSPCSLSDMGTTDPDTNELSSGCAEDCDSKQRAFLTMSTYPSSVYDSDLDSDSELIRQIMQKSPLRHGERPRSCLGR